MPGGSRRTPDGRERYAAVLDHLSEVVFQTDADGHWTYLNRAWTEITGFPVEDTLGARFLDFVHPEERERTLQLFVDVVAGHRDHCHHDTRYRTADGGARWMELRATVLYDDQGRIVGNVGTILDITDRREAEELLAEQSAVLERVARAEPLSGTLGTLAGMIARRTGAVVTIDVRPSPQPAGPSLRVPAVASAGLGVTAWPDGSVHEDLPGSAPRDAAGNDPAVSAEVAIAATGGGRQLASISLRRPDGGAGDRDEAALLDRCVNLAAIAIERRDAEHAAQHRAMHDPLTGLPNRALLADRIDQAISRARRQRHRVALLLLDLDHFKIINDRLGHETGDAVLRQVAVRLDGALRESDTVCRLGGDEFAIVLAELAGADEARFVADKVLEAVRAPLTLEGVDIPLDASVGVALVAADGGGATDLLRQADVAMYRAKRLRSGYAVYDRRFDQERLHRIGLAGELTSAIGHDDLLVHYQPQIELDSGLVVGVEALVRWRHSVRGLVAPDVFVPLAESTGSIKPLSLWVLRTALGAIHRLTEAGLDITVAVNLSAQILHDPTLPDLVDTLLGEEEVDGARLELEVTESAVMADPDGAVRAMGRLQEAGVRFAIDDFGTGYSSLSYLKRLPVGTIKIDRSFVREMANDERDASIVHSAIELAHNLGMRVVAEGVEGQRVYDMLSRLGCDYLQGFHIARPMPDSDLVAWIRRREAAR